MKCPACKEPMIVLEHNEVEVDYCLECAGVWLDEGELELLLEENSEAIDRLFSDGEIQQTQEAKRPCPACDKDMVKVALASKHPVIVDKCPQNHGFWFDQGELTQVFEQSGVISGRAELPEFLRQLFVL